MRRAVLLGDALLVAAIGLLVVSAKMVWVTMQPTPFGVDAGATEQTGLREFAQSALLQAAVLMIGTAAAARVVGSVRGAARLAVVGSLGLLYVALVVLVRVHQTIASAGAFPRPGVTLAAMAGAAALLSARAYAQPQRSRRVVEVRMSTPSPATIDEPPPARDCP